MKYMTLFTWRMMARVRLLLTGLLWWFSQSTLVAMNGPFIGVGVMGVGWVIE